MAREGGDAKRNPQTRKGTGYREAHSSVTPYTCETEIPFGPQMSDGSDNAMSSATANVFDTAWWPNGMEVRCPVAFAWGEKCQAGHIAHEESGVRHIHKAKIYYESLCVNLHRG